MRYQSVAPEAITIQLRENGFMTRTELIEATGLPDTAVSQALTRMRRTWATIPRRIHIHSYVTEMDGRRNYPRPVYALGDKPDARKPKPVPMAVSAKKWRSQQKARYALNSVFNMAINPAKRRPSPQPNDL